MRRFQFTVENGLGDVAEVVVDVRDDRPPGCYVGPAILRARRSLPDEGPWRVTMMDELGPGDPRAPSPSGALGGS